MEFKSLGLGRKCLFVLVLFHFETSFTYLMLVLKIAEDDHVFSHLSDLSFLLKPLKNHLFVRVHMDMPACVLGACVELR